MEPIAICAFEYKRSLCMETEKNANDQGKQVCECIIGAKKNKNRINAITEGSIHCADKDEFHGLNFQKNITCIYHDNCMSLIFS